MDDHYDNINMKIRGFGFYHNRLERRLTNVHAHVVTDVLS